MFEGIRIRLHSLLVKKKTPMFVNPYSPKVTQGEKRVAINPYMTDYGTKKTKSLGEILFPKKKELGSPIEPPVVVTTSASPPLPKEPPFTDDMRRVCERDLLWIASKCKSKIPKREPRMMKETDIKNACERIKW